MKGLVPTSMEYALAALAFAEEEVERLKNLALKFPEDQKIKIELADMTRSRDNYRVGAQDRRRRLERERKIVEVLFRDWKLHVPNIGEVSFRKKKNSGGGNCMYESILSGLSGLPNLRAGRPRSIQDVRDHVAGAIAFDNHQILMKNEDIERVVQSDKRNYPFVQRLKGDYMRQAFALGQKNDWWGDEVVLRYASEVYLVRFVILRKGKAPYIIGPRHVDSYTGTIFLHYYLDLHYELVELLLPGHKDFLPALEKNDLNEKIVDFLTK